MRTGDGGSFFRRAAAGSLIVAMAATGAVVTVAAPASAATCDPDTVTRGDLDGDGQTDAVVGMPFYGDQSGAVDVRYTGQPSRLISAGELGGEGEEGTEFGSAVAVSDLDRDGCADLVIGALRERGAGGYQGAVHIVFGGPAGLVDDSFITLPYTPSGGESFDDFGTSLAVSATPGATDGRHDLYVGAPGFTVAGQRDAGAVVHYVITPGGADRIAVSTPRAITQNSVGVPGAAEAGDNFGQVLAADDYKRGVMAAAPMEDVGRGVNAGAIWFLGVAANGAAGASYSYSQNSSGVPGTVETGDHFGSALSMRGAYLAVGVPDENAGSRKDTGMVQTVRQNSAGRFATGPAYSQNSAGVPGTAEAGDRFGAAVAVGIPLRCREFIDVAAGAPGEDLGTKADAGTITLLTLGGGCAPVVLRQGSGLGGAPETNDQVGSVLGITRGRTDLEGNYFDRLLIGVPNESVGAKRVAGIVQSNQGSITLDGTDVAALQFSEGFLNTSYYGRVLSSASD